MRLLIRLSGIFLYFFILSCSNPNEPDKNKNKIYIEVTDIDNNAIERVGFHYYYPLFNSGVNFQTEKVNKLQKLYSVELNDFNYTVADENVVELSWNTLAEYENAGFEIYRSQNDAGYILLDSYNTDSSLVGQGTTNIEHHYFYKDSVNEDNLYKYILFCTNFSNVKQALDSCSIDLQIYIHVPTEYKLEQNYPNPSDFITNIAFHLPVQSYINLQILNLYDNSVIRTLMKGDYKPGSYSVQWDGTDNYGNYVSNNIYPYKLVAGHYEESRYIFLDIPDADYLKSKNIIPLAFSDAHGKLEIKYDLFPMDVTIIATDETANELGVYTLQDSVEIFLIKEGYEIGRRTIPLDTTQSQELKFILNSQYAN
ncbi:MAG: hypothetical protein P8X42_04755 [Calditrichaceae bacterium]